MLYEVITLEVGDGVLVGTGVSVGTTAIVTVGTGDEVAVSSGSREGALTGVGVSRVVVGPSSYNFV